MGRPTREETDAARERIIKGLPSYSRVLAAVDAAAIRTLLAATEPATDEELAAEADRVWDPYAEGLRWLDKYEWRTLYARAAHREGHR